MKTLFPVISLMVLALSACNNNADTQTSAPPASSAPVTVAQPPAPAPEQKLIEDTQYITDKLKTIKTVGEVVIYTPETDPNTLLGRPSQYIGKLNFTDTRLKDVPVENGGTIEIFANTEDLDARAQYVENVTKGTPMVMYQYKHNNLLMRLPREFTPEQAKEYEAILKQM